MKITIVAPSRKMGGIERTLSVIANKWVAQGFKITYISCLKSDPFYKFDAAIKVIEPNFKRSGGFMNKIFFYPRLINYIRKQVKKEKPDRILSFGDFFNPLVLLALYGLKIPVYISDRTSADYIFPRYISVLKQKLYPKAAGFIAQTPIAYRAKAIQFGENFRKTIIPNPIRKIKENPIPKENSILYVGRFAWEKNPNALIEAFSKIENKGNWKLIMAGDGPQLKDMKTKAVSLGLDGQVNFLGAVTDVDSLLCKASIYVLPSVLEGFPNALCEAMAAKLPVICFESIPYESIITPNKEGFVIQEGDIEALSNTLYELMNDESMRIKIGENAYKKSKNWNIETIIEQYNKFLKLN